MTDVAVIGLGYVGLPLSLAFAEGALSVLGIDTDAAKVGSLEQSISYIGHVPSSAVAAVVREGRFRATTDYGQLRHADAILICVPTPLTANRTPDLTYIESTAQAIAPHLRRGHLVVLESTTYPGTTDGIVRPILEQSSGLQAGSDFHLAFSPEREDPGNPTRFSDIPKLVGGTTDACRQKAQALYGRIVKRTVAVRDCQTAEAAKLLENIFRAVNIALVNELKLVYAAMGIDIWEVIAAASTKPFGFMPFHPGPGLGGHCIPIDPFYLSWKALEFGQRTRLIELAGEINTTMPGHVVAAISDALNDSGRAVRGARILLLGLAYKPDVDDDRESPTYEIMRMLEVKGAVVAYNDPHIPVIRPGRTHHAVQGRRGLPISPDHDLFVLCTAHQIYADFDFATLGVPLVDCRNFARNRPSRYYRA
jgi:UDP-N-acetyl-D-glucosamine dehydrogenase